MPLQVVLGAETFTTIAAGFFAVMWLRVFLLMLAARKSAAIQGRAGCRLT